MTEPVTWVDEYYNVAEFFFWEPQHLGRRSSRTGKGWTATQKALQGKEPPLNHLLNYFLHLAPAAMIARILGAVAPGLDLGQPHMRSAKAYKSLAVCHPDVWLGGEGGHAFIEMKVAAKLPLAQIFRYAALAGEVASPNDHVTLLLLSPSGAFPAADAFESMVAGGGDLQAPENLAAKVQQQGLNAEDMLSMARRMRVRRATFADLLSAVDQEITRLDRESEGAETLRKLLAGVRLAFERSISGRG